MTAPEQPNARPSTILLCQRRAPARNAAVRLNFKNHRDAAYPKIQNQTEIQSKTEAVLPEAPIPVLAHSQPIYRPFEIP